MEEISGVTSQAMLGHKLEGERGTYGGMAGLLAELVKLPDPLAKAAEAGQGGEIGVA